MPADAHISSLGYLWYYTINVLWNDIKSPPAQAHSYFCFMILSCAALQLTLISVLNKVYCRN